MKYCGGGGGGGAARGDRDDAWGPGVGQQRAMLPLPSWINNPYGDPDGPAISMKPGHGGGVGAAASIGNRDEARVRSTARGGTSLFDGWGFGFTQQGGYVDPYDDRVGGQSFVQCSAFFFVLGTIVWLYYVSVT